MDLFTFIKERAFYAKLGIELIDFSDEPSTKLGERSAYIAAMQTLQFLTTEQTIVDVAKHTDVDAWLNNIGLKRKHNR